MTNAKSGKLVAGLLVVWFIAVLSASALHVLSSDAGRVPFPLLLAATAPIALFLLGFAISPGFRQFALSWIRVF